MLKSLLIEIILLVCVLIPLCFWWTLFRNRLKMKWYQIVVIGLLQVLVEDQFAKMLGWFEIGFVGNLSEAPKRIFGIVASMPFLFYAIAKVIKRKYSEIMDIACISTVLGMLTARCFCIVRGCCYGIPVFSFAWPIRELEVLCCIVFVFYYGRKVLLRETQGELYPLLMILYGLFRFAVEWLRVEYSMRIGVFHAAHIWSIISVIVGASFYFEIKENQKKSQRRARK